MNIRPISDLRNKFTEISKIVHEQGEPVFLTKNGYGDMVVMSVEQFESLSSSTVDFSKPKPAAKEEPEEELKIELDLGEEEPKEEETVTLEDVLISQEEPVETPAHSDFTINLDEIKTGELLEDFDADEQEETEHRRGFFGVFGRNRD